MSPLNGGAPPKKEPVITEILSTVSQAEGVDETDLTPPLGDVVDTDALERLVENPARPVSVTFVYRRWVVDVERGDGLEVSVSPVESRRYECVCSTCGTSELREGLRQAQEYFTDHAVEGCEVVLRNVSSSVGPVTTESTRSNPPAGGSSAVEE